MQPRPDDERHDRLQRAVALIHAGALVLAEATRDEDRAGADNRLRPLRVPGSGGCNSNDCPPEGGASVGTASGNMLLLSGPLAIVGAIKYRRLEKRCE